MWFDGSLAGLSIWITYCVQVVFAYLTTLCICSFIQNPRARVRMWGCFSVPDDRGLAAFVGTLQGSGPGSFRSQLNVVTGLRRTFIWPCR